MLNCFSRDISVFSLSRFVLPHKKRHRHCIIVDVRRWSEREKERVKERRDKESHKVKDGAIKMCMVGENLEKKEFFIHTIF